MMELADVRDLKELFEYVRDRYDGIPKKLILPDDVFDRLYPAVPTGYEVWFSAKPSFDCPVGVYGRVRVERKTAPEYVADVIELS